MAKRKQRKSLEDLISGDTRAIVLKSKRKVQESYAIDPDWDTYGVDDLLDIEKEEY